jgi:hypothetical protein
MSDKRKVYIESTMTIDELNKRYCFLEENYQRTTSRNEADFIIIDLNNPIRNLEKELIEMDLFIVTCKPVILASLENEVRDSLDSIRKLYNCNLPICQTSKKLEDTLAWFSFMFPRSRIENIGRTANVLTVLGMRTKDAGQWY